MKVLLLLALSVTVTTFSFRSIHEQPVQPQSLTHQEVLYLPNGTALQFLSFGYQNALAQFLWFKTINYFGKHYRTDRNYQWLEHMCTLVCELNPAMLHTYQFCATMLAWETGNVEASNRLLTRAIEEHPQDWLFWYLRGFNYAFFLRDEAKAKDDFVAASTRPGAHPAVIRLAGKKILNLSSPEEAIRFLSEMIESTHDPKAREALSTRMKEALYERDFRAIEDAHERFREKFGHSAASIQELAGAHLLPDELIARNYTDPFRGHYSLDSITGEVRSSSGKKRPKLYWKRS